MSDSDNALDNSDVSSDTGSMDRSKPKRMPMVNVLKTKSSMATDQRGTDDEEQQIDSNTDREYL